LKTDHAIYIVKGKKRSALINLETLELRSVPNEKLDKLDSSVELEEDIAKLVPPENDVYDKQILEFKVSNENGIKYLDSCLKDGMVYHNIRIICSAENEIQPKLIRQLISRINKSIYHFGIVILIPEKYNQEIFIEHFPDCKVLTSVGGQDEKELYEPWFYSTPSAILISGKNNLFHYSRDTIFLNHSGAVKLDHDDFNIPKHKIEGCKNCEFRLTCYDSREVQENDGRYFYNSTCKYEQ